MSAPKIQKLQENTPVLEKQSNIETNISALSQGIDSHVHEKISEIAGENIAPSHSSTKQTTKNNFWRVTNITDQIYSLIGSTKTVQKNTLPCTKTQVKMVEKTLKNEQKKLLKKAQKIQKSRHFSAFELEKIILQIRYIQKILNEIFSAASETIETLYKKFVLKTS